MVRPVAIVLGSVACVPVPVVGPSAAADAGREVPIVCGPEGLDAASEASLHALVVADGLQGRADAEHRIASVAQVFEACADRRGLFATAYLPITQASVAAIDAGVFDDAAWADALVVDFAGRYLDALGQELAGEAPSWAWDRYYGLAADPGVSDVRLVTTGMMAHLLLDLPHTLHAIGSEPRHEADFFAWGDALVAVTPVLLDALVHHYGVDASDLLGGFFWGRGLDHLLGEGTSTTWTFQAVRRKAWTNGRWLQDGGLRWLAETEIWTSFWLADGVLASLDAAGVLR